MEASSDPDKHMARYHKNRDRIQPRVHGSRSIRDSHSTKHPRKDVQPTPSPQRSRQHGRRVVTEDAQRGAHNSSSSMGHVGRDSRAPIKPLSDILRNLFAFLDRSLPPQLLAYCEDFQRRIATELQFLERAIAQDAKPHDVFAECREVARLRKDLLSHLDRTPDDASGGDRFGDLGLLSQSNPAMARSRIRSNSLDLAPPPRSGQRNVVGERHHPAVCGNVTSAPLVCDLDPKPRSPLAVSNESNSRPHLVHGVAANSNAFVACTRNSPPRVYRNGTNHPPAAYDHGTRNSPPGVYRNGTNPPPAAYDHGTRNSPLGVYRNGTNNPTTGDNVMNSPPVCGARPRSPLAVMACDDANSPPACGYGMRNAPAACRNANRPNDYVNQQPPALSPQTTRRLVHADLYSEVAISRDDRPVPAFAQMDSRLTPARCPPQLGSAAVTFTQERQDSVEVPEDGRLTTGGLQRSHSSGPLAKSDLRDVFQIPDRPSDRLDTNADPRPCRESFTRKVPAGPIPRGTADRSQPPDFPVSPVLASRAVPIPNDATGIRPISTKDASKPVMSVPNSSAPYTPEAMQHSDMSPPDLRFTPAPRKPQESTARASHIRADNARNHPQLQAGSGQGLSFSDIVFHHSA